MTITLSKFSSLAGVGMTRSALALAVFIFVAAAAPAFAANSDANVWQGHFQSKSRGHAVTVRLTLPVDSKPGELRLVTESCALGLSAASAGVYAIQPREGLVAGPYCGIWLGGTLKTQLIDDGQWLQITFVDRNNKSQVQLKLEPVPATQ